MNYKITVAYDGTEYAGWIQQKNQPSIVGMLEESFTRAFSQSLKILGASKTDAGVHAMAQVARVITDLALDPEKLRWAWNNALPESISILSAETDGQFHPHYDVVRKTYHYHFALKRPLPFHARYVTQVSHKMDIDLFVQALSHFKGTHDFAAFYTGDDRDDTIRTIDTISVSFNEEYQAYRVTVVGQKFLRHMIRRIVGAAMAVALRDEISEDVIIRALETKMTNHELPTAAAKGLMLYRIEYAK